MHRGRQLSTLAAFVVISVLRPSVTEAGLLYPRESESRSIQSLDGIWNFRVADTSDSEIGQREKWYEKELRLTGPTIPMPVPSSYNDITQEASIRDHVGVVWYDRDFYVPSDWNSNDKITWIRFGSVNYAADVYINGNLVVHHEGGHLPFQLDVTSALKFGQKNLISVAVNNTLTPVTVPQGKLTTLNTDDGTETIQSYTFDFFNYAGIHRPVLLYTTPSVYIDDISVNTDINGDTGVISYEIVVTGEGSETQTVTVNILDRDGVPVQNATGLQGNIEIPNANLWWPYLMDPDPAYLYTLEVVVDNSQDVYRVPVGIRKLEWNNDTVTINSKPLYLRGFGRHEDSDVRHDFPLIARDYNLLKWLGANAYRTSHYPYSEEIMDFADKEGIMIIDESPAVNAGAQGFTDGTLAAHKEALTRLYQRDKNRPSVIMWSLANEASTQNEGADVYFRTQSWCTHSLHFIERIVSLVSCIRHILQNQGQVLDVIGMNRYNAWYSDSGHLEVITYDVRAEAEAWRNKYNKPVLMTEYGADTMPGLHIDPDYIWSEEYQVTYLSKHFEIFDELRAEGYFIGELIWNFADFKTAQTYTRVGGNRKGIFTRERQPKSAAHHTRKRFWTYKTFYCLLRPSVTEAGLLYPRESESRSIQSLDGIWNFRVADISDSEIGAERKMVRERIKIGPTILMPVPSSYNDITQDTSIRDHVGVVWYDRDFYVPSEWNSNDKITWIRFGSVNYAADVYINGNLVVHHEGGHVPFQLEVTSVLKFGQKNLISIAVNNTLTDITVPQGQLTTLDTDDGPEIIQSYTFDFFNYAGIHRPVLLYTTPSVYIDDITVVTDVKDDTGTISYEIATGGDSEAQSLSVSVVDREGNIVQNATGLQGNIEIPNANLWWPYLMDPDPAYLYTLEVKIEDSQDVYRLPVGIRKLEWNNDTVTINGKPLYLRGFGRHEDSDFRGKGHDFPLIARDYNLIKWLGANAYRTSHYPYSEEIMDFADKEGIMIIDESPAVNAG
ncbi:hypothetical protein L9F63_015947, partial [Diploptera punctata]